MEIGKSSGGRLGGHTGRVAELNVRELGGSLSHILLVTKRVGENDFAAAVRQILGGVIALDAFGNVGLDNEVVLRNTHGNANLSERVDEVLVIGGVLVVQGDQTDLEIRGDFNRRSDLLPGQDLFAFALFRRERAGSERDAKSGDHNDRQGKREKFLEHFFSLQIIYYRSTHRFK